MNDVQVGNVQGNALVAQVGGDLHGDLAARDKNVYHIQSLTIYVSSRPAEPEPQAVAADIGPNPYKGLSAFQENDADRFFGREQVTQTLWEKFRQLHESPLPTPGPSQEGRPIPAPSREGSDRKTSQPKIPLLGGGRGGSPLRLLAVLGPSGSGKSSVARAGLLPELARRPLPGRDKSRVAVFTPGAHPMRAIAIALARMDPNHPDPRKVAEDFCRRSEQGEWDGLCWSAEALSEIDSSPLILLIDQFEEVYSQCEDAEQRTCFIENLLYAASDKSGHVSVILTLRSDFLGQTQSHPEFNHAIAAHEVIVPVMNDAELRQAIAEPAKRAGHPLDAATVDLLIEQAKGREGALPLLQFALMQIWTGLAAGVPPAETLKQIGGVGGALAGKAQQLFDRLSDADKAIARRAFLGLIQLGEGARDTRRRISLTEIVAQGEDAAHVQAVVRCFADPRARLVTLSANTDGTETAEVTHEALLDHWGTLKTWLDANRDDLRFHRHLAEDA